MSDREQNSANALMPRIRPVWRDHDVSAERDVLAFWREGKLLSQNVDLATRLNELCVLAYADDKVVGVNTAVITWLEKVRARIAMLRLAVAANYRQGELASEMMGVSKVVLERWAASNPGEKLMGIGCVVQTLSGAARVSEAVWPRTGLAVIDHFNNGDQLRLAWFANARIGDGR